MTHSKKFIQREMEGGYRDGLRSVEKFKDQKDCAVCGKDLSTTIGSTCEDPIGWVCAECMVARDPYMTKSEKSALIARLKI